MAGRVRPYLGLLVRVGATLSFTPFLTVDDFFSFRVLVASSTSGLIETIRDAISIHSIKKDAYARSLNQHGLVYTLYDYFVKEFGQPGCDNFQKAQDNFMKSLAAYSIIAYVLQVKDRHNGNILLDNEGHIIHIGEFF